MMGAWKRIKTSFSVAGCWFNPVFKSSINQPDEKSKKKPENFQKKNEKQLFYTKYFIYICTFPRDF